jgi:hypothetical protein
MIRLLGLWLVGCALCVTPVAAEEDQYDGPTAIRPLTVPEEFVTENPTVKVRKPERRKGQGKR